VRALDEGWSVAKIGPSGPKVSLRYRFDREPQPSADNRGDVAHSVALVTHGVPRGPGRRLLQDQPEEDGRVKRVYGRPALRAVARIARHSGAACHVGQQAGESAPTLVVDCARHADGRARDSAGGQVQYRRDRAAATADRSAGRQRVSLGGGAAWDVGRTRDCDEGAAAAGELLAQGGKCDALLSTAAARAAGLLKSLAKARWITPSAFAAPARSTPRSARSPRMVSAPTVRGAVADEAERARARTVWPLPSSSATTAEPISPVPPVTKTRMRFSSEVMGSWLDGNLARGRG
jgi:hypothetical protein